jgi:hypothetical protein
MPRAPGGGSGGSAAEAWLGIALGYEDLSYQPILDRW